MSVWGNYIEEKWSEIEFAVDDVFGVMDTYSLTVADVVSLCGGIPYMEISRISVSIFSQNKGILCVSIHSDQFEVNRTIDMAIHWIYNEQMIVYPKARNCGIATALFLNQVYKADELGFVEITAIMQAPALTRRENPAWLGYFFWANFGFINKDEDEFKAWARSKRREEESINELMLTEEGRDLWKREGYTWTGEFSLKEGSESFMYLRMYLNRRGIAWWH